MTTTDAKQRYEFVAVLAREFPNKSTADIINTTKLLMRHAGSYKRIQEMACNGCSTQHCQKQGERLERLLSRSASQLGCEVKFGGDPRGYTVKLLLPSARYNTWGGPEEGWGVPNS